jgi:hypothetical protein
MGQKSSSGKFAGIDTNKRACVYEYHVTSRVSAIGKLGAVTEHRCEISGWSAKSLKDMVARDGVELFSVPCYQ